MRKHRRSTHKIIICGFYRCVNTGELLTNLSFADFIWWFAGVYASIKSTKIKCNFILISLVYLPPFSHKRDNICGAVICGFLFAFLYKKYFVERGLLLVGRVCSSWEQILSLCSRSLFRSETKQSFDWVASPEIVSIPLSLRSVNLETLHISITMEALFILRGMDTFRRGNSVESVLSLFRKVIYSKRKEFAPMGNKFFSFRVDPFSGGANSFLFE